MLTEAQADMVLVAAGNLPVGPDIALGDMELEERNLEECIRRRMVEGLGILVPE